MMVPRSFRYSSPPRDSALDEKSGRRSLSSRKAGIVAAERRKKHSLVVPQAPPPPPPSPPPPSRTNSEPVTIPSGKPTQVPVPDRSASASNGHPSMPPFQSAIAGRDRGRRKSSAHDPHALPPSVAALLAVTAIPPHRPNRYRTRMNSAERVSIDQLVSQWKSDGSLNHLYSSSPALEVLLEDSDLWDDGEAVKKDSVHDEGPMNMRSHSAESMPDLEADDRSILSVGSPSTPGSLRSQKSSTNLRKDRARSLPAVEDCVLDHPLVPLPEAEEHLDTFLPMQRVTPNLSKPKSSFTSNLTTSLQSLKNAAISSISSLSRSTIITTSAITPHHIDGALWSNPYLFPRLSSEIRPATDSSSPATHHHHHYLNPMPLTFEEQEAPFQQALHAPYLAEAAEHVSAIQMQTYRSRGPHPRRRPSARGGRTFVDPKSEAGRALLGAQAGRQREVRENGDFLRVVVLEMNMRREGKLESGRARIWLPPRDGGVSPSSSVASGRVPMRWVGETVD